MVSLMSVPPLRRPPPGPPPGHRSHTELFRRLPRPRSSGSAEAAAFSSARGAPPSSPCSSPRWPARGSRRTADRSSNSTSVVAVDTLVRPLRADEARQSGALPRCSRSLTGLRSSASGNTRKAAAYAERRLDYAWRPSSTAYPTCVPMGRWMADLRARSSRQIAGSAAAAIKDIAQKPRAPKSP